MFANWNYHVELFWKTIYNALGFAFYVNFIVRFGCHNFLFSVVRWNSFHSYFYLCIWNILRTSNVGLPFFLTTGVYLAEMLQDKAYSMATGIIQIIGMTISAVLPFITYSLKDDHSKYGYIWLACGIMTTIGTMFIYIYMKETKGLSLK